MSLLLLLALLAPATSVQPVHPPQDPAADPSAESPSPYDRLVRDYESAHADWVRSIEEATDSTSRRAARKNRPEIRFRPQFEAISEVGPTESRGRSLLWLTGNAFNFGLKRSEAKELKLGWIEQLVAGHAGDYWFADALDTLDDAGELLGLERYAELVLVIVEKAHDDAVAAYALWQVGNAHLQSRAKDKDGNPAHREKGLALLERLLRDYPEDRIAKFAKGRVFRAKHLQVGQICPDFEAETADGKSFKLSDFRGKVTVVKFWGFW